VRVGIFQNEPIVFQDHYGSAGGLYVDLLDAIAEEEGWEIHYVLDSWEGCLERLQTHDIDLLSCIAYTEERDAYADFSHEVVWTLWGMVYVNPESNIEDVPSLSGKRVAVLRHGINGINFQKLCKEFGVECQILAMPSYDDAFKAVESGEADAVVVNSVFGQAHGNEYNANRTSIVFSPISAFFAVPQGQGSDLTATVDEYLQDWKQERNSVYNRSLTKWLAPDQGATAFVPYWILVVLSSLALGAVLLLLWTWLLRRLVNARTAALRESEEKHRLLTENLPQRIFHKDAECTYVSCNRHYAQDLGIEPDEIAGKTDFDFHPHELAERYRADDRRLMESGQTEEIEEPYIKDGQERFARTVKTPLRDDSGNVIGILGIFWDITDRKQAEIVLRESEERLSKVFLASPDTITLTRLKDGHIIDVNEAFERMSEVAREDAIGRTSFELDLWVDSTDRTDLVTRIREGLPLRNLEYRFRRKSGEIFDSLLSGEIIEVGGESCILSIIRDITESKKAEEALKESEERFRGLAEMLPVAVFETDQDLNTTFANRRAFELFGYSSEDIKRGIKCLEMFVPEDRKRARAQLTTRVTNDGPGASEYHAVRKDGSAFPILFHANSVMEDDVLVGVRGIIVDMTETKRLQDLESRAERLETAGTIAGQVAHDFNNLLAPLVGYPELIREDLPHDHVAHAYLDTIESAAKKIASINQDLVTMSRRGHYSQDVLDLNRIVLQVAQETESRTTTVSVQLDLCSDLMNIKGGEAQIHRLLTNLTVNAQDAMQDLGKISIVTENYYADETSIAFGRVLKGEYVRLTVSDNGCGIAEDIIPKILDPFFSTKTTDKNRGSGLGLSIVDAVIRDHNGYLDLTTKIGQGTSFYLYFPVFRETVHEGKRESLVGGTETVLIIDDDEIQREVSSKLLAKLGYDVSFVESGEQAIEFLKERPQDILMLDMVMPGGIDGAETYRRILEIRPHQKAIILSGFSESERVLEAQRLGAGAFVKKPITKEIIATTIRAELDRVVETRPQ
jgi:PAS domain S-box-containing protein